MKTEVLIVGGGPAGMSAALWCADLGLDAILLEKGNTLGGQLNRIFNPIENYLGLKCANGAEMLALFERALADRKFDRIRGAEAVSLDPETKTVSLVDGRRFSGDAIIIATGVRRRKLNIPGENEFQGKGILESGSGERQTVTGKRVLIVGGGDAAVENALILAEHANRVFLVHRRSETTTRPDFLEAMDKKPKIEKLLGYVIESINGDESVQSVTIKNAPQAEARDIAVDHVLIRIGVEPNTDFLAGAISLDPRGYIIVDSNAQTNVAGIFAAGDVAYPISPTIATAAGTAATAIKAALALLKTHKSV